MAYKYNSNKGRNYDPGTYVNFEPNVPKEKTAKENNIELDKKYREIVIKTIESKMAKLENENALILEKIIHEIALNPRIKKHFEYLERIGFDLEEIFENWYKSYMSNKERGNAFEGMEQGWKF